MLEIDIALPTNPAAAGVIRLLDDGAVLLERPCLGRADNRKAAAMNNPRRDPRLPWGDVPLGRYPPARALYFDGPRRIGEAAIPLELKGAVGGQVEAARANGRWGLFIHAGRGTGRLVPTFGCVRVEFRDFVDLLAAIGDSKAAVIIRGAGD